MALPGTVCRLYYNIRAEGDARAAQLGENSSSELSWWTTATWAALQ